MFDEIEIKNMIEDMNTVDIFIYKYKQKIILHILKFIS
jgi:hypothetical protein